MPKIYIDVTRKEIAEARAAKKGRSWREVLFEALDIEEEFHRLPGSPTEL